MMEGLRSDEMEIHMVSSTESAEYRGLKWAVAHSSIIGLDAEWKPTVHGGGGGGGQPPPVLLLQIACRLINNNIDDKEEGVVYLVDLSERELLPSIYEMLKEDVFECRNVLKLGFRFKQDLLYLSSTFRSLGGFHTVEPYMDIAIIYNTHLQTTTITSRSRSRKRKGQNSLSSICQELLGFSLSKELQCSDWSQRPLTKDQTTYAALDALCLIHIFHVFYHTLLTQGALQSLTQLDSSASTLGLKQILQEPRNSTKILRTTVCEAVEMIRATMTKYPQRLHAVLGASLRKSSQDSIPMDYVLLQIVRQYGDKILLTESDGNPKTSRRKGKRKSSTGFTCREKRVDDTGEWHGPAPWDYLLGGDGCPKFLCDVMVEGLAKHLRCVGIDAAVPYSRKPETRELIDQAIKEKRVLLTRDAKLLRHEYLLENQIYRVKSLLKNDQLLEVIETFQLNICEDQLMSRCTKCNGRFIQKPLSMEEAIEAAKGFQVIPNCLFDRNIEFWQCTDCHQLYWEGTQYHNAVQKFIDVCKISSTT
uniref:uncharacterized protein LOC122603894 n=1 Tax=Erigeron canadensis TaxID=72917 RepID=UPI001CB8BBB4|nr:uncharacterized protein LOC122603894 [Erigeron canadensis]